MSVANRDQAEHWNGSEQAAHWVSHQQQYDRMLAPFIDMILGAAALSAGDNVLDVGCGCGSTTLAAAEAAAPGPVVGVDLSAPMLARARDSAALGALVNASFEQGDAQDHPFGQVFDVVISRFGVMFFADPVAAFANLRAATRPGGRMAFVCWQPLIANEWLMIALAALAEHVRLPDPPEPGAPGMFSLAEPGRIQGILGDAGWRQVTLTSRDPDLARRRPGR
jgi:SAM-dependent methyltransferase